MQKFSLKRYARERRMGMQECQLKQYAGVQDEEVGGNAG
jgi:hypothetical protein